MHTVSEIAKKLADYCAYQERCHSEVEQKLREFSLDEDEKAEILTYLIRHGFLSEERFARSFVRGKFYQKQWGKIKIISHLRSKQIPEGLINTGLKEIDEQDYRKTLSELAQKKWRLLTEKNVFAKQKKLLSYLSQKGYENEMIFKWIEGNS